MKTKIARTDALRERLLSALAANRTARLNFPGVFMGLTGQRQGRDVLDMQCGHHDWLSDRRGDVHLPVVGVIADIALGAVTRLLRGAAYRPATVQLGLQFTGAPVRGEIHARSHCAGLCDNASVHQALSSGVITAGGRTVAHATGAFVLLQLPNGTTQHTDPWLESDAGNHEPLREADLRDDERAVLRAYARSQRAATRDGTFAEHFWCGVPRRSEGRASLSVAVAPHMGNRVGQVHGGILLGLAADVACAGAPAGMRLSNLSAWYISPGQGPRLRVRSDIIQRSRNLAVVRTQILGTGGVRVLETTSQHVRVAG